VTLDIAEGHVVIAITLLPEPAHNLRSGRARNTESVVDVGQEEVATRTQQIIHVLKLRMEIQFSDIIRGIPDAGGFIDDAGVRRVLRNNRLGHLVVLERLIREHDVVEAEAGGVWLGSDGKKILVDAYEAACQRSATGALPGYSGSWRRHIAHSAQMLVRAIAEPDHQWSGVTWR